MLRDLFCERNSGSLHCVRQRLSTDAGRGRNRPCYLELPRLFLQQLQASTANQPKVGCHSGQSLVGIILAKKKAVLSPAGKHPIWFLSALRDKIVYQNADVSFDSGRESAAAFPQGVGQRWHLPLAPVPQPLRSPTCRLSGPRDRVPRSACSPRLIEVGWVGSNRIPLRSPGA